MPKMSNGWAGIAQYPLTPLWYGVCLQANGKYDEALEQLKQFAGNASLTLSISALC
jgi:OOP family OmpA-OmpF porin